MSWADALAAQRSQQGRRAERLAERELVRQGYRVQRRNVRYPVGEIDLIAMDGDTLCFVEVRSTSSDAWGGPLATVTDGKRRRIIAAARWFLASHRGPMAECRFDVVGVLWRADGAPQLELVRGAFTADGGCW